MLRAATTAVDLGAIFALGRAVGRVVGICEPLAKDTLQGQPQQRDDDEVWPLEVSWKDDVGRDPTGRLEKCEGHGVGSEDNGVLTGTAAIEGNAFDVTTSENGVLVLGSFEGDTATGTALYSFHPGMGPGGDCELAGGWTASPAQ